MRDPRFQGWGREVKRHVGRQTDWLARERVPLVKHLPKHEELSLVPETHIKSHMSRHTFVFPYAGKVETGRQIPGARWPASLG